MLLCIFEFVGQIVNGHHSMAATDADPDDHHLVSDDYMDFRAISRSDEFLRSTS